MKTIIQLTQEVKEEMISKGFCDHDLNISEIIEDRYKKYPEGGLNQFMISSNEDGYREYNESGERSEIEEFYIKYILRRKLFEELLSHRYIKIYDKGKKKSKSRYIKFGNMYYIDKVNKKISKDLCLEYIMMIEIENIIFKHYKDVYLKHLDYYNNQYELISNKYRQISECFKNSFTFFYINRYFKPEYLSIKEVNDFMRGFSLDYYVKNREDIYFIPGLEYVDKVIMKMNSNPNNPRYFEKLFSEDKKINYTIIKGVLDRIELTDELEEENNKNYFPL